MVARQKNKESRIFLDSFQAIHSLGKTTQITMLNFWTVLLRHNLRTDWNQRIERSQVSSYQQHYRTCWGSLLYAAH
jgi:hypothetical protein